MVLGKEFKSYSFFNKTIKVGNHPKPTINALAVSSL